MSTFPRSLAARMRSSWGPCSDPSQENIAAASPGQEDDSWLCTVLLRDRSPLQGPTGQANRRGSCGRPKWAIPDITAAPGRVQRSWLFPLVALPGADENLTCDLAQAAVRGPRAFLVHRLKVCKEIQRAAKVGP